jgi:hypothetical protein
MHIGAAQKVLEKKRPVDQLGSADGRVCASAATYIDSSFKFVLRDSHYSGLLVTKNRRKNGLVLREMLREILRFRFSLRIMS